MRSALSRRLWTRVVPSLLTVFGLSFAGLSAQEPEPEPEATPEATPEAAAEPEPLTRWQAMNYGPVLGATVQGLGEDNFAYKGRIVFLPKPGAESDSGDSASLASSLADCGVVFDTELLRVVGAYGNEALELQGTAFDGAHGAIPTLPKSAFTRSVPEPGVRGPDGDTVDPRPIPYGPLPEAWGRYVGHWIHGDRVVLGYTVSGRGVLETYDAVRDEDGKVTGVLRTIEVGPGLDDLQFTVLSVAEPQDSGGLRVEVVETAGAGGAPAGAGRPGSGRPGAGRPESGRPGSGRPEGGGGRPTGGHGGPPRGVRPVPPPTIAGPFVQYISTIDDTFGVALVGNRGACSLSSAERGRIHVNVPGGQFVQRVAVLHRRASNSSELEIGLPETLVLPTDLAQYTRPGENRYPETFETTGLVGDSSGPFAVDTITIPESNPYASWLRFAAFDFVDEDTAALSTWNGDVWLVSGLDEDLDTLTWRRFCTGLHDPLGLKVVDGIIYVHCRDGLHRLLDENGDGWCDFVEVFNNEVYVTEGFHEFAFDLQTDDEGNFYFSKGGPVNPGGRGFMKLTPHSGTILRTDPDGQGLEILATGCRAPNGISVRGDGTFTTGDNEGTWVPACRLSISTNGDFFGCRDLAHEDPPPERYDPPICFFPMAVDNSCGGQAWVPEGHWGPLGGQLLHQSYGQTSLFCVLQQKSRGGVIQGGVYRLPVQFASTPMRSRFGADGHLYTVGFRGWQTNAAQETAFQRVRRTEAPLRMPIAMSVSADGVELTFSEPLDREVASDAESYELEMWNYDWSENYGSREVSVLEPSRPSERGEENRDPLRVIGAIVSEDGRSVTLAVEKMRTCMQLRLGFDLESEDGELVAGNIFSTVHFLEPRGHGSR